MGDHSPPPSKRLRVSITELAELSKEEVVKKFLKQQDYAEQLEAKLNASGDDADDKEKTQSSELNRRENILVMRLATKEQEVQNYAAQISLMKKTQDDAAILSLRQANLDPGVNLLFGKMREELQQTKDKLEQAQSELSAWKFTPDSQNGKKLMSRCRTLIAENQELGKQLSQGKSAELEAELALQKKYSEELKTSGDELNEFVIQLDEEVEGMQSTIQVLQQQLAEAKTEVENHKRIIKEHEAKTSLRTSNEVGDKELVERSYKVDSTENYDDEAALYSGEDRMVSPRSSSDTDKEMQTKPTEHGNTSSGHNGGYRTRGYEFSPERFGNVTSHSRLHGENEDAYGVDVKSPGTPTGESMQFNARSPGTPTEENMEYDEAFGSWEQHENAWSDRTSSCPDPVHKPTNGSTTKSPHMENIGASSPTVDEPDIQAHITSVGIPLDNDPLSQATTNLEDLNHTPDKDANDVGRTTKAVTSTKTAQAEIRILEQNEKPIKPGATGDKQKNLSSSNEHQSAEQTNNEAKVTGHATTPPATVVPDQATLLALYQNMLAQKLLMPDGKTLATLPGLQVVHEKQTETNGDVPSTLPYSISSMDVLTQQGALLAATSTGVMPKSETCSGVSKKLDSESILPNHSIPAQNGVEEIAAIEKAD